MRKESISSIVWIAISTFFLLFTYRLNAWPLTILFLLFSIWFIIDLLYGDKIPRENKMRYVVVGIILLYSFMRYSVMIIDKNEPYYTILKNTSDLIDSNFVLIVVTALYTMFTFFMFLEMEKTRKISQRPNVTIRPEQENCSWKSPPSLSVYLMFTSNRLLFL